MARLARPSQNAAKATWMNPPTRRTRLDHAVAGVRSAAFRAAGLGVTGINGVAMAFTGSGVTRINGVVMALTGPGVTRINGVLMALTGSGLAVMTCWPGLGTRRRSRLGRQPAACRPPRRRPGIYWCPG